MYVFYIDAECLERFSQFPVRIGSSCEKWGLITQTWSTWAAASLNIPEYSKQ